MSININGNEYLYWKDAVKYLGIEETQFQNLSKEGKEIQWLKIKNKWHISKENLDNWAKSYEYRSIFMIKDEYLKCLIFAIQSYYEGAQAKSDFLSGEKREIGKFAHDIIMGKLAELAMAKFLYKYFNIKVQIEFSLINDPRIAFSEDIVKIESKYAIRNPRINIEIKSSNKTSVHLLIPKSSFEDMDRKCDVFVFIRMHLYMNHLIRFFRDYFSEELKDIIYQFEPIRAEIVGFAWRKDIIEKGDIITELNGNRLRSGENYHLISGQLRSSEDDWAELAKAL